MLEPRNEIYGLKLHEETNIAGRMILRVAGGWIYRFYDYTKDDFLNPVFVPFNCEFVPTSSNQPTVLGKSTEVKASE